MVEPAPLRRHADVEWAEEYIRAIKGPTLLILGDADVIRSEHGIEMFRLLGGGVPSHMVGLPAAQLATLPGTTHGTIVTEKTDPWLPMVEALRAAPEPEGQ